MVDKAMERNLGARGLRAVMEGVLTKIMYEIPSRHDVAEVIMTPEAIRGTGKCDYVLLRELPEELPAPALPEAE